LKVYLDASVPVALLTADALTARAEALMQAKTFTAVVSDFAVAEVVSAVARRVRTKAMQDGGSRAGPGPLGHNRIVRTSPRFRSGPAAC
jgi:predicted nucleic acid-binding protein